MSVQLWARILVVGVACATSALAQKRRPAIDPEEPAIDYACAFAAFDDARRGLYLIRSPRRGSALLDELDRALIDVRKAIFDAARLAKAGRSDPQKVESSFTLAAAMQFQRVKGNRGYIRVGQEWMRFDADYTGLPSRYRTAIDALHAARQKLAIQHDAKEARRIADEMTRLILDARRALWKQRRAGEREKKGETGKTVPKKTAC